MVDLSPKAVNELFELPSIPDSEHKAILQGGFDIQEVIRVLIEHTNIFLSDWKYVDNGWLTVETWNWYYFIAARLMPVNINLEVLKKRAFFTMIAKNMWKESIGFLSIAFVLC